MRVIDVNNFYSPTGGGVRTYHEEKLAWYARQSDHLYALVVPSDRSEVQADGQVQRIHVPATRVGSGYRFIFTPSALRRAILAFRPDVVEIGGPYIEPLWQRPLLAGIDCATVGFYHADYPDTYVAPIAAKAGAAGRGLLRLARAHAGWVYRRMTATFGASEFVLRKLRDAGVRRLFHTPLGVDTELFTPARRDESLRGEWLGDRTDGRAIVFLGRLSPEKGVGLLMEAFPEFSRPGDRRLLIGGHGPWEERVAAFAASRPDVLRLGWEPDRTRVASLLASADAVLVLGEVETFSLVTLEALACGTPVIAPAAGGAGELVSRAGLPTLFEPGSAGSLAAAVDRACALDREAVRARLREHVVRSRSWDRTFRRETDCYARVLAAARTGDLRPIEAPGGWHALPGEASEESH